MSLPEAMNTRRTRSSCVPDWWQTHGMEQEVKWLLRFNFDKRTVMHVGYSIATLYTTEQDDQLSSLIKDAENCFDVQLSKVRQAMCTAVRKSSCVLQLIKRNFIKHDKSTIARARLKLDKDSAILGTLLKSGAANVWHKLQDVSVRET